MSVVACVIHGCTRAKVQVRRRQMTVLDLLSSMDSSNGTQVTTYATGNLPGLVGSNLILPPGTVRNFLTLYNHSRGK